MCPGWQWTSGRLDLAFARRFAGAIRARYPGRLLAYNCSPSFSWKAKLDADSIRRFQRELGAMGYQLRFITVAGLRGLNFWSFRLAEGCGERQTAVCPELQQVEFAAEAEGYTATPREAGAATSSS